jgi:methyl-accepting chemotaxis protein/methyl-accepting chemotaxis protein-1 (serine sensor receptor)
MRLRLMLGGLVMLVLLAMAGLGLFALHRTDADSRATLGELAELQEILDTGRQAETAFKRQVQEWKNLLLRARDDESRARLETSFRAEQDRTAALLRALAEAAPRLPPASGAALAPLAAEHAALGARYAEALAVADPTTAEGPRAIDARVRGADRALEQKLDAAADGLAAAFASLRAELAEDAARRYAGTRRLLLAGSGIGLALVLALLLTLAARRPA